MAHCININSPEYSSLVPQAREIGMGQRDLKAQIAAWQVLENTDQFPTISQIEGLLTDPRMVSYSEKFDPNILNNIPGINGPFLKGAIDSIIENKQANSVDRIHRRTELLSNPNVSSWEAVMAFREVFTAITTTEEKAQFLKERGVAQRDESYLLQELSEEYADYLIKPENERNASFKNNALRVFGKIDALTKGLKENYTLIKEYARNPISFENDMTKDSHVYEKIKKGTRISLLNKTTEEINQAIENAKNKIRSQVSDFAKIKVSTVKESRYGDAVYVYMLKPKKSHYGKVFSSLQENSELFTEAFREKALKRKETLMGDSNTTTAKDVLEKIISLNDSGLAKTILKNVPKDFEIEFVDTPILLKEDYNTEIDSIGVYLPMEHKIVLSLAGMNQQTIMHEILHGLSVNYIHDNPNAESVVAFKKIYEEAVKALPGDKSHAMSSPEEFLVALFSNNKEFVNKIKQLPPTTLGEKFKNMFSELINKVLEFFGITTNNSMYHQAFSVASNIITENYDYIENGDARYHELTQQAIEEYEYELLNTNFSSAPDPVNIVNSPFTQSFRDMLQIYKLSDIKDLTSSITSVFVDTVSFYQEENPLLSRQQVIAKITPAQLFQDVRTELKYDLEDYIKENANPDWINNLEKLLDNLDDMIVLSTPEINFLEDLRFNPNDFTVSAKKNSTRDNTKPENTDFNEEDVRDGWMVNYKFTSVGDSLTPALKKALRSVSMTNKEGEIERDSIGFAKRLNLEVVKNDLLKGLQNMDNAKDLMPTLEKMAKEKPWINSMIAYLEESDVLPSQFFGVMAKHFVTFGVTNTFQKPDETLGIRTIIANESDNLNLWIDGWRSTLENNFISNKRYSLYDSTGKLVRKNIENNIKILKELTEDWAEVKRENDFSSRKKFASNKLITLKNQLNALGIDFTSNEIKNTLSDIYFEGEGRSRSSYSIDNILKRLLQTNNWALSNIDSDIRSIDLLENNRGNYTAIAKIAAATLENLTESSFRESGKSRYSYLQPSYLTKLVKNLNNSRGDISKFNEFIDNNFKAYEGTLYDPETNMFRIPWLNALTDRRTGQSKRDLLKHKEVVNFGRVEYSDLTSADYQMMLLAEYFAASETASFHVPILADAPAAEFISFEKITVNVKENIASEMLNIFRYEYDRIQLVEARRALREQQDEEGTLREEDRLQPIENLDDRGGEFVMLEFLNEHREAIDALVAKKDSKSNRELASLVKGLIIENLDLKAERAIEFIEDLGLLEQNDSGKLIYLDSLGINKDTVREKLEEYFYNSYYASANIIMLTTTDLSYYQNVENFQKRNKQIHAPGVHLNTEAMYKGERIGKDTENYIVLQDLEIESSKEVMEAMSRILDENDKLSKEEKDDILRMHKVNNITDAQAYRFLDSYKSLIGMHVGWEDYHENAYQNLKNNTWSMEDYNTIFQALKPFVYTQYAQNSGILIDPKDPSKGEVPLKVPTQHKNSEILLLPQMAEQFNSPKLRGINRAMELYDIDVVMFKTAVKEGSQGVIDINSLESSDEIAAYIGSFKENSEYFKSIPYEDYKIQQPVPESLQDTEGLVASQVRRILTLDTQDSDNFYIRGQKLTRDEALSLYDNVLIENILETYTEVSEMFNDPKELQEILENEIIGNDRYARDLLTGIQMDEQGRPVLPYFEPSQSNRIQQLLHSVWKSRTTKQRIKGGKVINMSSYGVSDLLTINYHTVDGKTAIESVEAFLPFPSENMPTNWEQGFVDPNTGIMDVNTMLEAGFIDENFLEAIAYRVPTEDDYSIVPIKIKGFLPRNMGGNIILPREITTRTGLDFDIDAMYLMLKEFTFENNKFKIIEADLRREVKNMTREERNNLFIELSSSILKSPSSAFKQTSPGNFNGLKATSRRLNILAKGEGYSWQDLKDMSLQELQEIVERDQLDMLDFTTQIALHKQNMTAGKIIGMAAIHSVNHSLRQRTNIGISDIVRTVKEKGKEPQTISEPRFYLNGEFRNSLHDMYAADGKTLISKNNSEFTAASVDAVSDPVLSSFNLNLFTADSLLTLIGAGYSKDSVGLLFRQPIIEEVVNYYEKNVKKGMTKEQAIKDILLKYKNILTNIPGIELLDDNTERLNNKLLDEDMAEAISLNSLMKEVNRLEGEEREAFINEHQSEIQWLYSNQYGALLNFQKIVEVGNAMSVFIGATRADSNNGGAGPTNADTAFKLIKTERHIKNQESKNPVLTEADVINIYTSEDLQGQEKIDWLRDMLRDSPIGFVQAFTTLGLVENIESLKNHFPHFNEVFEQIFDEMETYFLKSEQVSVDLMNSIYGDYFAYYMSQFESFKNSSAQDFLIEFPKRFQDWVQSNPDLKETYFIKNLVYSNPTEKTPIGHIALRTAGAITPNIRDQIMMEWESLLYNADHKEMAMDLFKYTYYRNGFNFGGNTFAHLAPAALKLSIPGYREQLYGMIAEGKVELSLPQEELWIFINQYIRNHMNDQKLVPVAEFSNKEVFKEEDGSLKETVSLTNLSEKERSYMINNSGYTLPYIRVIIDGENYYYNVRDLVKDDFIVGTSLVKVDPLNINQVTLNYDYLNEFPESQAKWVTEYRDKAGREFLDYDYSETQDYYRDNVEFTEHIPIFGETQEMTQEAIDRFEQAYNFTEKSNEDFKRQAEKEGFDALTLEDMPSQFDIDQSLSIDQTNLGEAIQEGVNKKDLDDLIENCQ